MSLLLQSIKDKASSYSINICGTTPGCNSGSVCLDSKSYGSFSTDGIIMEGEDIKFSYSNGDSCGMSTYCGWNTSLFIDISKWILQYIFVTCVCI